MSRDRIFAIPFARPLCTINDECSEVTLEIAPMEYSRSQSSRPGSVGGVEGGDPSTAVPGEASPNHLRRIVDSIPILVWTARPDGSVEYFNKRWLDYTGISADEALNRSWIAAFHRDDRGRLADYWRVILASGDTGEIEARMRRFDRQYRWFLIRANAQFDGAGRIVRWYGTNTDIEDRRRAELALQESERNLRLLIDTIPGLVFTTTAEGQVEFVNAPLRRYFGRTLAELQTWQRTDVIHPDDLAGTVTEWRRGVESGKSYEFEQRLRRADGAYRFFHFRATPLRDSEGRIVRWYGLLSDIDDVKHAKEALRSNQARLSRAMHLASISELSASIAHEVNQPLAAVIANGQACQRWLSHDLPNVERALHSADKIVRDGKAAADVIRRVRSLYGGAPPKKTRVDLNGVIDHVHRLVLDELRVKGIALETSMQAKLPQVVADDVQMQQVVANLVRNGIEAVEAVNDGEKRLSLASRHQGNEVVVEIADSGVGLTDPSCVFESFYTTKADGMGLGLTISRSIVETHGGRLWAVRNKPHGTKFAFGLPIAARGRA
jgi:PAS domain S-box-containing protein